MGRKKKNLFGNVNNYKSFITEWTVGALETIDLPLESAYGYLFEVDYGDGTVEVVNVWNSPNASHEYALAGTYQVKITGKCEGFRFSSAAIKTQITDIIEWGVIGATGMNFTGCTNLTSLTATDVPDFSLMTSMGSFFSGCTQLNNVPNINTWITSSITSMTSCFNNCDAFNQDISNWDVSNVQGFGSMFNSCLIFNQPLNSWITSSATNMSSMFKSTGAFNQPLNLWDTSQVTTMNQMFSLSQAFNSNINGWDVSKVTDFQIMFGSSNAFTGDLHNWTLNTTSNVNCFAMFNNCPNFDGNVSLWNTSRVTNMSRMFQGCSSFTSDIGGWDVGNVVTFYRFMLNCNAFNRDLTNWDVSSVSNFNEMFSSCDIFNGNVDNWVTTSATNMAAIFANCAQFNQPVDHFDMNGVTNIDSMFLGCAAFNQPLNGWDTSTITVWSNCLRGCTVFNQPLDNWDVSGGTSFYRMFYTSPAFNQDITGWNTTGKTNMADMFFGATAFNQDLSSWDVSSVTNLTLFGDGAGFDIDNYTNMLIGWDAQNVQPGVTWDMGTARYSCELGQAAWDNLTNSDGWTINDGGCVNWNTLVGGVGATSVTSRSDLATLLSGVNQNQIYAFDVDGSNNVSCYIETSHALEQYALQNDTDLTYYLDLDGNVANVNGWGVLSGCANLEYAYFPNAAFTAGSATGWGGLTSLKKIHCLGAAGFELRTFAANLITKLDLPIATEFTPFTSMNIGSGLKRVNLKSMVNLGVFTHVGTVHNLLGVTNGCKIFVPSSFGVADRNAFGWIIFGGNWTAGDTIVINGLTYTAVNGAAMNEGEFDMTSQWGGTTDLKNAINADTRIGTLGDVSADHRFSNLGLWVNNIVGAGGNAVTIGAITSATKTIVSSSGTNFVGGNDIHIELYKLRDQRSATIVVCGAPIAVDPPTGVSVSNITSNSVDVNFTAPTPNANGNDGYEVWLDDGSVTLKLFDYDEIAASGDTISGLQSGTNYDLKVRTIDGEMNFSAFTSIVQFTTL